MSAPAMPSIQSVRDSHRGVIVTVTGLTAALAMTVTLAQSASSTAADPALEARVKALSTELRCLVCQNQTVADSDAPVARDLRDQVRTQLAAGKSEEEGKQYMTDRFGDFVLYKPPLKAATVALWLGPFAVLLFAAFLLTRRLRQSGARTGSGELSDAERARARALLGDTANSSVSPDASETQPRTPS